MKKLYFLIFTFLSLGIVGVNAQYIDLLNFNGGASPQGNSPYGSLTRLGNKLYGMTYTGGTHGDGNVFSVDTNGGGYRDLLDLSGANGNETYGSVTIMGTKLYCMASHGGAHNYGCIFYMDTNGAGYKDIYDFTGLNGGQNPYGNVVISGKKMYAMTLSGGGFSYGNVFSIDTNGGGYKDLFDFNRTDGESPYGSLVLSAGKLYGLTSHGGANLLGNIFSIDTSGSDFKDLYDFSLGWNSGVLPNGSLILSGYKLYGLTYNSGGPYYGNVFSIDTNGAAFTDLHDFGPGTNGANPQGSLILSGRGVLLGMTSSGGANRLGNVFAIDTNGGAYFDLYNFASAGGDYAAGDLIYNGNLLYGMTPAGGTHGDGVVFSLCPVGVATSVITNVSCFGGNNGSATATIDTNIGSGPYAYLWAPSGSTKDTINGLTAGTYTVTASNNNGCTQTATVTITQPTLLTATMGVPTNVLCYGGNNGSATVTAVGGTPSYTYAWAPNGGTNANGTGLTAGSYTVNVTDNNGCTATATVTITQPTLLIATMGVSTNVLCYGGNNGNATVTAAGGTPSYTYVWAPNGGTNANGTGLTAGSYTVNVTDNNGCTATVSVNITQPTGLSASATETANALCGGGNTGSASSNISGGTSPYTYLWAPSGGTTDTAVGLSAGIYTLSVKDNNGCTATASVSITQLTSLIVSANITANVLCNGGSNGSVSSNVSGGIPPYTYLWAPSGGSTDSAVGLSAGTYTLNVSAIYGCTGSASVTITQPLLITVVHDSVSTSLLGCTGIASVTPSGGAAPYTYLWTSGGQTTDTIKNQCAGTYCCTITDNDGCSLSTCVTIDSCVNNYNEPICIVMVDTANNKCEVIWGRTNSPPSGGYGYYNIYRDTIPGYGLVHSQVLDSLSEYIDTASNPSAGPVSYKLSTFDSCGESTLSAQHTTIYLTTIAGVNVYILNWTAYIGFTPSKYRIFRGPSMGTLTQIDSVPNSVLTYHDTLPPIGSYYAIEAVNPSGSCIPTHAPSNFSIPLLSGSFSNGFNTKILGVNNIVATASNLNIYPNPNNGMFTLSYSMSQNDNVQINIINELGQVVYSEQKRTKMGANTEQLNLGSLAPGIYSLRLQTNNGIIVRKLVKIN